MYKYAFIVDVTVFAPTQYVCQIIHSEILLSLQKKNNTSRDYGRYRRFIIFSLLFIAQALEKY